MRQTCGYSYRRESSGCYEDDIWGHHPSVSDRNIFFTETLKYILVKIRFRPILCGFCSLAHIFRYRNSLNDQKGQNKETETIFGISMGPFLSSLLSLAPSTFAAGP